LWRQRKRDPEVSDRGNSHFHAGESFGGETGLLKGDRIRTERKFREQKGSGSAGYGLRDEASLLVFHSDGGGGNNFTGGIENQSSDTAAESLGGGGYEGKQEDEEGTRIET